MTLAVYKSVCVSNQSVEWNFSVANGTACRKKKGTVSFPSCKQHIMLLTGGGGAGEGGNLVKCMKYLQKHLYRVIILF
jgi:hypothetical protein